MRVFEGNLQAQGLSVTMIVSRFNEFITGKLLAGAQDAWVRHGGDAGRVEIVWVPGAFEIPLAAKVAASRSTDMVVCLGAVIRGSTPHFEYVSSEVSKGVAHVALESGKPVAFGVLTCDTIEQAIERAGTKAGNKGFEAMVTAMEMANLLKAMK